MAIIFPTMTPENEAEAVKNTERREHEMPRKDGDRLYLIPHQWWTQWCHHTGHAYDPTQKTLAPIKDPNHTPGPRPGKLNFSDLIVPDAPPGDLTLEELSSVVTLRSNLQEKHDFVSVYQPTFQLLKEWYGVEGPEVSRCYIAHGPTQRVDFNLMQRHIKVVDDFTKRSAVVPINPQSSIADLKKRGCKALGIEDPQEYTLYNYAGLTDPTTLESALDKTIAGARIEDRRAVLLKRLDMDNPPPPLISNNTATTNTTAAGTNIAGGGLQPPSSSLHAISDPLPTLKISTTNTNPSHMVNATLGASSHPVSVSNASGSVGGFLSPMTSPLANLGGSFGTSPRFGRYGTSPSLMMAGSMSPLSRSFGRAPVWAEDIVSKSSSSRPGLAGLGNLGNTCFMNSSLQCMVHTMPLMDCFLTGKYQSDLNRDNPLGLGGKLATAFGSLMRKLWQPEVSVVSPKHFKWQLGKFAPQFGGYAQQDSQELLAFLLDGLHEDLNRIIVKPYTEDKDADGRPDEEVAAEAWSNYRARNDSVIVDNFQGLLKSTLRCPKCDYHSVKFDPFMYLTVPLPTALSRVISITVVDVTGTVPPMVYSVEVPKNAAVRRVYNALGELLSIGQGGAGSVSGLNRPEEMLLLGQWNSDRNTSFDVFTDLEAQVSVIAEPLPIKRSFFSLYSSNTSSTSKTHTIAYLYPSPAAGPLAPGNRPVVLHNKGPQASFSSLLPPLVLFLPEVELAALKLEPQTGSNYWQVVAHSQEQQQVTVVEAALNHALLPFHRTEPIEKPVSTASGSQGLLAGVAAAVSAAVPIFKPLSDVPSMTDLVLASHHTQPDKDESGAEEGRLESHPLSVSGSLTALPILGAETSTDMDADTNPSQQHHLRQEGAEEQLVPDVHARGKQENSFPQQPSLPTLDIDTDTDIGGGSMDVDGDLDGPDLDTPERSMVNSPSGNSLDSGNVVEADGAAAGVEADAMNTEDPSTSEDQEQQQQQQPLGKGQSALTASWLQQQQNGDVGAGDEDIIMEGATPVAPAPGATTTSEPIHSEGREISRNYTLLLASQSGQPRFIGTSKPPTLLPTSSLPPPTSTTMENSNNAADCSSGQYLEPVHLCVQWTDASLKQLDLGVFEKPRQHESAERAAQQANAPKKAVSLMDCVEAFCQPEQLEAADCWYCSKCKDHVQAAKKLDLWRLPDILVVHLKRFSYSKYNRDKLDTLVDFPLEGLDLSAYVPISEGGTRRTTPSSESAPRNNTTSKDTNTSDPPPLLYDLYAVSNHYGGMGGGHYTAYCRMPDDSRWYTFDDSSVREMRPSEVHSTAAYVLFYRRRRSASSATVSATEGEQLKEILERAAAAACSNDLAATSDDLPFGSAAQPPPPQQQRLMSAGPSLELVGEEDLEESKEDGGDGDLLISADIMGDVMTEGDEVAEIDLPPALEAIDDDNSDDRQDQYEQKGGGKSDGIGARDDDDVMEELNIEGLA